MAQLLRKVQYVELFPNVFAGTCVSANLLREILLKQVPESTKSDAGKTIECGKQSRKAYYRG
jgi:hypothetical protein